MRSTLTPSPPRRCCLSLLSAFLVLLLCPLANARQAQLLPPPPPPPPAPQQPPSLEVISRVTAAKTIFLSNAGGNDYFNGEIPGGPNVSYNQLYAALQQWGYFQLVDSPAHADLIFQIRGTELAPNLAPDPGRPAHHRPAASALTRAHYPDPQHPANLARIDTITAPAGRDNNVPKGAIAFARSIEWLTYQISTRVSAPRPDPSQLNSRDTLRPSFETLIQFTAPVPPQVLNAKSVYLINDTPDPKAKPSPYFEGFTTALSTWGFYHQTDSPQSADVVFRYHDDPANGTFLTIEDPATNAILWTITDPHHGFYHHSGAHRITALNQNLVTLLKQLNHIPLTPAETAALH